MPTPSVKGSSVLDRAIPRNPKYDKVKTKINSGPNMRRVMEKEEGPMFARVTRKNEFFMRLKTTTLHKMIADNADDDESVYHLGAIGEEGQAPGRNVVVSAEANTEAERPYLLLDVRTEEEYEKCHIPDARSFPATLLNRGTNVLTREILQYKNHADKFIIVYDMDEKVAVAAANNMVEQQHIDNVYVITGGLKDYAAKFPAFVEGEYPEPPKTTQSGRTHLTKASLPGGSVRGGPGSVSGSVRTERTVATTVATQRTTTTRR